MTQPDDITVDLEELHRSILLQTSVLKDIRLILLIWLLAPVVALVIFLVEAGS